MALARYTTQTTTNHLAAAGRENANGKLGKPGLGKPVQARAALGNRNTNAQANIKKGLKKVAGATKPVGVTTRATAQAQKIKPKEAPVVIEEKASPQKSAPSPSPMNISDSGPAAFSDQLLKVQDIDKEDKDNPQLVSEYVNDIYEYLRELERATPLRKHYLEGMEVNSRMRGILIDWLVQVHLRFHLLQETLYLTVSILDRFLQCQEVPKNKLQLVGVTAMLLASKYEEMYAPEINDFVYITDNAYTKSDIRKMEILILKKIDFGLGRPIPLHFLRRNSKAGVVDADKHVLAKYLMELTIVDYESVHLPPSEIAAAALCLSMKILDEDSNEWTDTLAYHSRYTEKQLLPAIQRMAFLLQKAGTGKLTAIKTKYQSSKQMRISTLPQLKCTVVDELAKACCT